MHQCPQDMRPILKPMFCSVFNPIGVSTEKQEADQCSQFIHQLPKYIMTPMDDRTKND